MIQLCTENFLKIIIIIIIEKKFDSSIILQQYYHLSFLKKRIIHIFLFILFISYNLIKC